jgi:multisubunit Na+/H+ antiporter MnhG subunit
MLFDAVTVAIALLQILRIETTFTKSHKQHHKTPLGVFELAVAVPLAFNVNACGYRNAVKGNISRIGTNRHRCIDECLK